MTGIYQITNTETKEIYIGSSVDIYRRWGAHRCKYRWNEQPNNKLYIAFQKYGLDKFVIEVLEECKKEELKEKEQYYIELLKPQYNKAFAKGQIDEKMCLYKNKIVRFEALRKRFQRKGILYPSNEARKYLI